MSKHPTLTSASTFSWNPACISVIRCPIDGAALEILNESQLQALNKQILAGRPKIRNRSDTPVTKPCDAALRNQSGNWIYPVRQGVLSLLADDAIPYGLE